MFYVWWISIQFVTFLEEYHYHHKNTPDPIPIYVDFFNEILDRWLHQKFKDKLQCFESRQEKVL